MRGARRILLIATLTAAVTAGVAGCTAAPDGTVTTTVTATASSAVPSSAAPASASVPTAAGSSGPTASGGPRADPDAPAGQCSDADLAVSVQADPEGGAAGHDDSFVVFRNTGSASCRLEGFPGLSVVGHGNGTQLGRPASRPDGAATPLVVLRPGGTAVAETVYSVVDAKGGVYDEGGGKDPRCRAERGDGYRVYPPHSTRAFFVRAAVYACTTGIDWISVQPVRDHVTGFTPRT
ncbi:DUF4232 domain-containing protein [Amnibacterium setariae]|uniref:DUF4232 domain-containing protein n=1 Tax=Amnibacterium setariae TaxID=2306585 RepID=A0A3A1TZM1_9MICO|nr:DUF4232 domain-containing protein [Amnibacterium setariae]RIX28125.1 DUF4232 domain-containing protein [Amnibacterium setariae]